MSNTHYDNVMNIILEVRQGNLDVEEALAEVHQHVKEEPQQPDHEVTIIIGLANVHYQNNGIDKYTRDDVVVVARQNGSIVVLRQEHGVKPWAYIRGGADIQFMEANGPLEVHAGVSDQKLHISFNSIEFVKGLP